HYLPSFPTRRSSDLVPCERNSVVRKLRIWRSRSATISGSSLEPSTPQFHDRLSGVPSWLSSRLASLCFSLYDTRSASVKPSCARSEEHTSELQSRVD